MGGSRAGRESAGFMNSSVNSLLLSVLSRMVAVSICLRVTFVSQAKTMIGQFLTSSISGGKIVDGVTCDVTFSRKLILFTCVGGSSSSVS